MITRVTHQHVVAGLRTRLRRATNRLANAQQQHAVTQQRLDEAQVEYDAAKAALDQLETGHP